SLIDRCLLRNEDYTEFFGLIHHRRIFCAQSDLAVSRGGSVGRMLVWSRRDIVLRDGISSAKALYCGFSAGPVAECAGGGGCVARKISERNLFAARGIEMVGERALAGIRRRFRRSACLSESENLSRAERSSAALPRKCGPTTWRWRAADRSQQ